MTRYVFSTAETIRYRYPTHENDLVLDRAEAATTEVFVVVLEPGEAPPLHQHDDAEQIFYILDGTGTLTIGEPAQNFNVTTGDVVRIPPHTQHSIKCDGAHAPLFERGCFCRRERSIGTDVGRARQDVM